MKGTTLGLEFVCLAKCTRTVDKKGSNNLRSRHNSVVCSVFYTAQQIRKNETSALLGNLEALIQHA
jgi:hypothetical protein